MTVAAPGAEGPAQGKHKAVAGLQRVRQDGPGRAWLAEYGGHDQGPAPARLRRTHPPAACMLPVLRPAIPSWPSSVLRFRTTPATGTTAVGIATIAASAGTRIAALPRRTAS